jgi:hypothetical protein
LYVNDTPSGPPIDEYDGPAAVTTALPDDKFTDTGPAVSNGFVGRTPSRRSTRSRLGNAHAEHAAYGSQTRTVHVYTPSASAPSGGCHDGDDT